MNKNTNEKAKDFKKSLRRLIAYLKNYKVQFIIVIVFAILSTMFAIVGPKILGKATTKLVEGLILKMKGLPGGIDFDYILRILLILGVLYILSAIFQYIESFVMAGISGKISFSLRKSINEKIDRIPISYYDKTNYGDTLSRVSNDVDTINHNLSSGLIQSITALTMLIGIIVMMLSISPLMTGVVFIILPIAGILMGMIVKKSQKYFTKNQETIAELNDHIEESYGGHLVIKAFNKEDYQIKVFNKVNDKLYLYGYKSQFFGGILYPIIRLLGNVAYVITAVLGGYLAVLGKITIGNVQAFLSYSRQFLQPVGSVANVTSLFQSTVAAAERVFEFLDVKEEPIVKTPLTLENIKGEVEFKNVSFSYDKKNEIIKDFSLKIKPGAKVAIVGPTGAGKTTIVNLLMHFYDLDKGTILVDNKDISKIDRGVLRNIFGMVLQDTWLFNDTILENIRFGNLDATDEEIKEACISAQADHFIKTLPDGYDMILNEDSSNIAEGEKQLLTIARALLANPQILILDEATSNVDTRTEILIQKAMNNLMKDKTSFIIAHRLSTIREADIILVMNEGKIIETGNHQELLNKKGFYYDLYNSQFETSLDN